MLEADDNSVSNPLGANFWPDFRVKEKVTREKGELSMHFRTFAAAAAVSILPALPAFAQAATEAVAELDEALFYTNESVAGMFTDGEWTGVLALEQEGWYRNEGGGDRVLFINTRALERDFTFKYNNTVLRCSVPSCIWGAKVKNGYLIDRTTMEYADEVNLFFHDAARARTALERVFALD